MKRLNVFSVRALQCISAALLILSLSGPVLWAAIVYFETDSGTVAIETVHPDATVVVRQNGNALTVQDRLTHSQVSVENGQATVRTRNSKSGTEFEFDHDGRLTIRRGDDVTIRVWPVESPPKASETNKSSKPIELGLHFVEMQRDEIDSVEPSWIVSSPQGQSIYVSGRDGHVLLFTRNPATGRISHELTYGQQPRNKSATRYETLKGLAYPRSFTITPDGKQAYFGNVWITCFSRDLDTGRLTPLSEYRRPHSEQHIMGQVESLAVSPDGKNLYAVGTSSETLLVFDRDPVNGQLERLEFFQDDNHDSDDKGLTAAKRAKDAIIVPGLKFPRQVVVSSDGRNVYTLSFSEAAISTFTRNSETGLLKFESEVRGSSVGLSHPNAIAVSPDGRQLYCISIRHGISAFDRDATSGSLTYRKSYTPETIPNMQYATDLRVSPDGKTVCVADSQGKAFVMLRRREDGALHFANLLRDEVGDVDGLAGVKVLTFSTDSKSVYGVSTEQAVTTFSVAPLSPETPRIPVETIPEPIDDGMPYFQHQLLSVLETGIDDRLADIRYLPDGSLVATSAAGNVQFWDVEQTRKMRQYDVSAKIRNVAFSPNGKLMTADQLTPPQDGRLSLLDVWSAETGELVHRLPFNNNGYYSLCFSPGSRYLAESRGASVRVWDMQNGETVSTFDLEQEVLPYGHMVFSPDGEKLIIGEWRGNLGVWNWRTGARLAAKKRTLSMSPLQCLPNREQLIAVDDKVRIYQFKNLQEVLNFPVVPETRVPADIDISSDGRLLAEAEWETAEVRVRSMVNGRILARIPVREAPRWVGGRQLAFSRDSGTLAVGRKNVRLWKLQPVESE